MAKQKAAKPNASSADVHLMPWEQSTETDDAEKGLLDAAQSILADDDANTEEQEVEEAAEETAADAEADAKVEAAAESTDETGTEAVEAEAEPTFDIEGETVTLSELKKRGLREADYTRKTQKLAEKQREIEAELADYRQKRDSYTSQLDQLKSVLEGSLPKKPDASLRDTDPAEYAAQMADYNDAKEQLAEVERQRQKIASEQQEEYGKHVQSFIASERDKLFEKVPEWKDEKARDAELTSIRNTAVTSYGFAEKELETVLDHRLALVFRDAHRYRESLQTGKARVEKVEASRVLKPGGKVLPTKKHENRKDADALKQKLRRTGREADAIAAIESLLG